MTELLEVAPKDITAHPKNPRHQVGNVDDLADSIRSVGLLEPLVVAPQADGSKGLYRLIAGHRRLAAAKAARVKTVPVILRADLDTEPRQIEAALVENLHRKDLSPIEEAEGYQLLLDFPGYTQAKIAKATGRSPATIRDRLKLTKLPAKTRERIHTGQITLAEAATIAEFADDPKALKRLEADAGTTAFQWTVQRLREAKKDARDAARARKELEAAGVKIVPDPGATFHGDAAGPRRLNEYGGPAISIEEHAASCEHHAAAEPSTGVVRYVCLDPSVHDHLLGRGGGATPAEKVASKAERDRAAKFIEDHRTATALRWSFIKELCSSGAKAAPVADVVDFVLPLLVEGMLEPDVELWARFLGAPDEVSSDYEAAQDFAAAAVAQRKGGAFLAVVASDLEGPLGQHYTWALLADSSRGWLRLLAAHGYQLSAFEQDCLDKADAAAADHAASEQEPAHASGD